jgi:hypothetical protein
MSLNDLEKKLYDSDSGIENRKHESNQFDSLNSSDANKEVFRKEKQWEKVEDTGKIERKKIYKIGAIVLGAIILVAALVVGYVKFRQSAFKEERVSVKIEGPLEASGSEDLKYKIMFKNDNRSDLSNAQILLSYPENFKPKENINLKINDPASSKISVGLVKGHSEGIIEISGTFLAVKDSVVYLNAIFEYTPSNFSIKFQSKNQLGINVKSSPLVLEIDAPSETVSGNRVEYVVNFRNTSTEYFDGIRLKVEYPEGFSFLFSDVSPSEGDNVWYLGSLKPDQNGKIIIAGKIQGSGEEGKIFKAYLGYAGNGDKFVVYNQKEHLTKMTSSPLFISQSLENQINSNIDPGQVLRYSIEYKNNGNIALGDVVITEEINSRILDFSKLELNKGSYDALKKTITWRAAEIPNLANLAPGEGGKISFSIPVLERIPVENVNDNNFIVASAAKIDSPSISNPIGANKTISSSQMELRLNSKVVLDVKGYYNDSIISNSGPLPPKVGQETSYTIHWKIINISNNINDVKVVSSLPSGVKWKGKFSPESESISFNERTNQIEWEAGNLKNGTGIINPAKEVSFQISIIPQVNQVGEKIILLNTSTLTAKDTFTNADVKAEVKEKDNILTEDSSVSGRYKVIQ